jgi:hypothetical protein
MHSRQLALAVASNLALMLAAAPALAGQEPTTESERKSDHGASHAPATHAPAPPTCSEHCLEDGYAWAKANDVSEAADCDPSPEDFGLGCRNYVLENMPALPAEGELAAEPQPRP